MAVSLMPQEKTILCFEEWKLARALSPIPPQARRLTKGSFLPEGQGSAVHRSASTLSLTASHVFVFELTPHSLRVMDLCSRGGADVTASPRAAQWHRASRSSPFRVFEPLLLTHPGWSCRVQCGELATMQSTSLFLSLLSPLPTDSPFLGLRAWDLERLVLDPG